MGTYELKIAKTMDFDWLDLPFDLKALPPKDIEESFEDPFSLRILPEFSNEPDETRFFNLGKSVGGQGLFSVFWTDGKKYRVIYSRCMSADELSFYERINAEAGF
ncbi:MAG: BrnT family toxin [Verrucomicrobiales bacterium]